MVGGCVRHENFFQLSSFARERERQRETWLVGGCARHETIFQLQILREREKKRERERRGGWV